MKAGKIIIPIIISCFCCQGIQAQGKLLEKSSVSAWFGFRYITRDSLPDNDNIDFLNYLDFNHEKSDDEYLGFTTHVWFNSRWETDIKIAMYSDFVPTYLNVKGIFKPYKHLGFTLGVTIYPHYLSNFDTFHKRQNEGFYGDINSNMRQRLLNETGFMAGIVLPFSYNAFSCSLYLNCGVSSMITFDETFNQKEINSNLRRVIHYETRPSPAFFFMPEAELRLDILHLRKVVGGIQLQPSWYTVNRSLGYSRTTFDWTDSDPVEEIIENPVHHFEKFDIDFGIYLKW